VSSLEAAAGDVTAGDASALPLFDILYVDGAFARATTRASVRGLLPSPTGWHVRGQELYVLEPAAHYRMRRSANTFGLTLPHSTAEVVRSRSSSYVATARTDTCQAPGAATRMPPHDVQAGPEGAIVIEAFSPSRSDWQSIKARAAAAAAMARNMIVADEGMSAV
jgi:hypothetical protein